MAKKKASKAPPPEKKQSSDPTVLRGISVTIFSVTLMLSLLTYRHDSTNWLGLIGHAIGWTAQTLFGLGSYVLCLFIGWLGLRLLFAKPIENLFSRILYATSFILSFCILLCLVETVYAKNWAFKQGFHLGGLPIHYLYHDLPNFNLLRMFSNIGVGLIFSGTLTASLLLLLKITPAKLSTLAIAGYQWMKSKAPENSETIEPTEPIKKDTSLSDFMRYVKVRIPSQATQSDQSHNPAQEMLGIQPETNLKVRPSLSRKEPTILAEEPMHPIKIKPVSIKEVEKVPAIKKNKRDTALDAQRVHNGDFSHYALPSLSLLTTPKKVDQSSLKSNLRKQAEVLEETLSSFGIEAKVGQINCGPTITSFEVHPAIGVKVQKIKALENDIALNMEAKSIRIIAPIPGKAAVGIEVPNSNPQEVGFKDMLQAYQQGTKKFHIPILLGKAVNGDYVMSDLAKMPHCIIAGATGSGKSVCINTIIMSILHNARPDEIKLIMVDPKKVELTPYSRLPHMLAPVITEPRGACAALNYLVKEMENRYEILKLVGVRNIEAFNTRTINKEIEDTLGREIPAKMPYFVGIIDELADLMMVASSDIETPIARIAQMARAVGIHLILATQRPSREVITGLIKANFPTRISFKVASRVNSQIVLDETGAESLLGNGDMLFLPPGSSHLVRAQGAFIRDEDINAVVKSICDQAPPNYVIQSFDAIGTINESGDSEEEAPADSLYHDARNIVLNTGNASTTFLQRKLKIGYARAASLMDELERQGIVGPAEGSKARKVLAARQASADVPDLFDEEGLS